jgi:hypothetical protein
MGLSACRRGFWEVCRMHRPPENRGMPLAAGLCEGQLHAAGSISPGDACMAASGGVLVALARVRGLRGRKGGGWSRHAGRQVAAHQEQ